MPKQKTDFSEIAGHICPKRALEVAVAGDHSILLVGSQGSGKQTLTAGFYSLGGKPRLIQSMLSCWCGMQDDPSKPCSCSVKALDRYQRRLIRTAGDYDMFIEVCPVSCQEQQLPTRPRETSAHVRARIALALAFQNDRGKHNGALSFTDCERLSYESASARRTLEMVIRRRGLGVGEGLRIVRVARTIADLSGARDIQARAVAEAVQYRLVPHY